MSTSHPCSGQIMFPVKNTFFISHPSLGSRGFAQSYGTYIEALLATKQSLPFQSFVTPFFCEHLVQHLHKERAYSWFLFLSCCPFKTMGTKNNKINCLWACGKIVLSHITADSRGGSNPIEKKFCSRCKTRKSICIHTLYVRGFPNRREEVKLITCHGLGMFTDTMLSILRIRLLTHIFIPIL